MASPTEFDPIASGSVETPVTKAADQLKRQLVDLSFAHHGASLFITQALSLGSAIQLVDHGMGYAWLWWGVMVAIDLFRAMVWQRFRFEAKNNPGLDPKRIAWVRHAFNAGLVLSGAGWGVMSWFAMRELPIVPRLGWLFMLSVLAGAATGVLAPARYAARAYLALLCVPASIALFLPPDPQTLIGTVGFVVLGVLIVCHRNNHAVLLESLLLRGEKQGLLERLHRRHDEVQKLNQHLERRVAERTAALEKAAQRDWLTALLNRSGLLAELENRLGGPGGGPLAVLFLDLDQFKQINDGLGHDVGDTVLRVVASRFAYALPADAAIGRWGGDEFVVLMRRGDGLERCKQLARSIQDALIEPIVVDGEPLQVDVSIGIALSPAHGDSAPTLIRAADLAATEVKRSGRGSMLFYQVEYSEAHERRLEISLALRQAIAEDMLKIAYQPIVDCLSGHVETLEALIRWEHPGLGIISPDEFIGIAEESNRIIELGTWVLNRACHDAMSWSTAFDAPRVAVNVSLRQLLATNFQFTVTEALQRSGLPASRLELEVTESVFDAQHTEQIYRTLDALHEMGVQIHIDDFGTGYSSLARLHQFPLDAIKIDRTFVNMLDGRSSSIIEGAIYIARAFGLRVIAEGVETEEQARVLTAMGVNALQGYLLGPPDHYAQLTPRFPRWATAMDVSHVALNTPVIELEGYEDDDAQRSVG